jgi:hypothetical protein
MSARYTVTGSPAFEAEIDSLMEEMTTEFLALLKESTIALALGGGYGRGEGGVWRSRQGEELYNDLDLVWIHRDRRVSKLERQALAEFENKYREKTKIHVDIMPIYQHAVAELPPALTWYEFGQGHRMLYGKSSTFDDLKSRCLDQVAGDEWGRLLMNRSAGIVFARWVLAGQPIALAQGEPSAEFVQRQLMKAWLAIGDMELVERGCYHRLVVERKKNAQAQEVPLKYLQKYLRAIDFKFDPVPAPTMRELKEELEVLAEILEPELRTREASPRRPSVGLYATIFHVAPQHWLSLRPDLYPRERLRFAFAAELAGEVQERERLVGNQNSLLNLWSRYA